MSWYRWVDPEENWFGNLFNWLVFQFLGGLLLQFAWIFLILGQPNWFYDTMISRDLLPSEVKSYDVFFDED